MVAGIMYNDSIESVTFFQFATEQMDGPLPYAKRLTRDVALDFVASFILEVSPHIPCQVSTVEPAYKDVPWM
jgi:hypothetical protein